MEIEYYNKIKTIGSVTLKGTEIALIEMINKGLIEKDITAFELIELCAEFTKNQRKKYEDSKVEQRYGIELA